MGLHVVKNRSAQKCDSLGIPRLGLHTHLSFSDLTVSVFRNTIANSSYSIDTCPCWDSLAGRPLISIACLWQTSKATRSRSLLFERNDKAGGPATSPKSLCAALEYTDANAAVWARCSTQSIASPLTSSTLTWSLKALCWVAACMRSSSLDGIVCSSLGKFMRPARKLALGTNTRDRGARLVGTQDVNSSSVIPNTLIGVTQSDLIRQWCQ